MRRILACLIMVTGAAYSYSQEPKKDDAPKGDVAKVQGKWTGTVGPNNDVVLTAVFKDNTVKVELTIDGQEKTIKGEFKLDESKTPKQWDWTKLEGPDGNSLDNTLAIYKIDGDKLTLCTGGPGQDRPTEFKAGESGPPSLVEFTKVKEEPKK